MKHVIPAPRIDGSSDEAFDRSHARLVQSLVPEDRLRLTLAEGIVLAPLGCLTDSALRSCRVALDGMGFQDIMARAYPAGSSAGIEALRQLVGKDNFAADGALYTGVQDPVVRAELNARFDRALDLLIAAAHDGAETSDYLTIIDQQINSFDRYALDTEDAERVASNFEKAMDYLGIESSGGILNTWMYGVDGL